MCERSCRVYFIEPSSPILCRGHLLVVLIRVVLFHSFDNLPFGLETKYCMWYVFGGKLMLPFFMTLSI